MKSKSVCYHKSDNEIADTRYARSPICLSRVWLQTEVDGTKFYCQLIKKITIPREIKEEQPEVSILTRSSRHLPPAAVRRQTRTHVRNYNFECDWLI